MPHVRYFAFIRAINVGARRLTNDELVEPFIRLGFADVAAYQAAGNITFVSEDDEAVRSEVVEEAASAAYGFHSPVFLRSWTDLAAIASCDVFGEAELAASEGRVQVSFLHHPPGDDTQREAMRLVPESDSVVFLGREWYWLPKRGVADSRLPVSRIERLVGPMTMRTLGTIERMAARFR